MQDDKINNITDLNEVKTQRILEKARGLIDNLQNYDEEELDRKLKETIDEWEEHKAFMEDNDMEEVFTPEEVAKYLKVAPKTIREYLKAGKLKGFKMGKQWRIRKRDLEAFIDAGSEGEE
jgi:excisionase family DNA binding protein